MGNVEDQQIHVLPDLHLDILTHDVEDLRPGHVSALEVVQMRVVV